MKNTVKFFSALGLVALLFMSGCTDLCKDVDCGTADQGTCLEGDCVCESGYEGLDCQTLVSARYAHTYAVSDLCAGDSIPIVFATAITASSTNKMVVNVTPFYDAAQSISIPLTISESNMDSFSFTGIVVGALTFTGTGTRNKTGNIVTLTITYSVTDTAGTTNCVATLTSN